MTCSKLQLASLPVRISERIAFSQRPKIEGRKSVRLDVNHRSKKLSPKLASIGKDSRRQLNPRSIAEQPEECKKGRGANAQASTSDHMLAT